MYKMTTAVATDCRMNESTLLDTCEFYFMSSYDCDPGILHTNFYEYARYLLELNESLEDDTIGNYVERHDEDENINVKFTFTFNNILLILVVNQIYVCKKNEDNYRYDSNDMSYNLYLIVNEKEPCDEKTLQMLEKIKLTYKYIFDEANKEVNSLNEYRREEIEEERRDCRDYCDSDRWD